jgi:hypothetical protein
MRDAYGSRSEAGVQLTSLLAAQGRSLVQSGKVRVVA